VFNSFVDGPYLTKANGGPEIGPNNLPGHHGTPMENDHYYEFRRWSAILFNRKKEKKAGLVPVLGLVLLEAVPAVDRSSLGRLEWYLGLGSAVGALNIMHFAGFAAVAA
jgi:hypothetical protein